MAADLEHDDNDGGGLDEHADGVMPVGTCESAAVPRIHGHKLLGLYTEAPSVYV